MAGTAATGACGAFPITAPPKMLSNCFKKMFLIVESILYLVKIRRASVWLPTTRLIVRSRDPAEAMARFRPPRHQSPALRTRLAGYLATLRIS